MPGHDLLTTDALAKLPSCHTVDMSSVRQFVCSQLQHSLFYALEGRKEYELWFQEDCDMNIRAPGADLPHTSRTGGGFSSPVLKPRNPRGTEAPSKCMTSKVTDGEVTTNKRKRESKSAKSSKDLRGEKLEERRDMGKMIKDEDENSHRPRLPIAKKRITGEKNCNARKEGAHSDDESKERLAQRRARRRQKREIVDPRPETEASLSGAESNAPIAVQETLPAKKSQNRKKKSEDKLPAGLALLHGFSAKNLAKHRLTVSGHGASAVFGVFGKGKASNRSKVLDKKGKPSKAFDEELFLKKMKARVEEKPINRGRRVKMPIIQRSTSRAKSSKSSSSSALVVFDQSSDSDERSADSSSTVSKQLETSKELAAGSVVWDIEREFLPVAEHGVEKDSPSLIVNTRDCGWAAPSVVSSPESRLSESLVQGNVSTVAPSQSASQVMQQNTAGGTPQPQLSRYFLTQKIVVTGEDDMLNNRSTSFTGRNYDFKGEKETTDANLGSLTDNVLGDEVLQAGTSSGSIFHETQDQQFIQEHAPNSDLADGLTILYNACLAEDPNVNYTHLGFIPENICDGLPSDACLDALLEQYNEPVQEDILGSLPNTTYDEFGALNQANRTNEYINFTNCSHSEAENNDAYVSEIGVGTNRNGETGRYQDIIPEGISGYDCRNDELEYLTTCSQTKGYDNLMDEVCEEDGFLGSEDQTAQVLNLDYDMGYCDGNNTTGSLISSANSSTSNDMVERTIYIAPFSEGRSLLLGIDDIPQPLYRTSRNTMENVETMVAKEIRGHWHPLKL